MTTDAACAGAHRIADSIPDLIKVRRMELAGEVCSLCT
jgi:hypothetical protein